MSPNLSKKFQQNIPNTVVLNTYIPKYNKNVFVQTHKYPIEEGRYMWARAGIGFCMCEEKSCRSGLSGPGYTDSWIAVDPFMLVYLSNSIPVSQPAPHPTPRSRTTNLSNYTSLNLLAFFGPFFPLTRHSLTLVKWAQNCFKTFRGSISSDKKFYQYFCTGAERHRNYSTIFLHSLLICREIF